MRLWQPLIRVCHPPNSGHQEWTSIPAFKKQARRKTHGRSEQKWGGKHTRELKEITTEDWKRYPSQSQSQRKQKILQMFLMSQIVLTEHEIFLLSKGLNFCPIRHFSLFDTILDMNKFVRNLTVKKHYFAAKDINCSDLSTLTNIDTSSP